MLAGLIAGALVMTSAVPANAQFGGPQKSTVREGFVLPAGNTRILVFRPDVSVGSQTTGGMNEPNAQWTQAARANMLAALDRARKLQGSTLVMVPELEGERSTLVADYTALFKAVAIAAFNHKMFPGNRLPTKRGVFDWTLGEGAGALRSLGGDYGLFFYTYDSYGSTGRKIAQVVGLLMGVGLIPAASTSATRGSSTSRPATSSGSTPTSASTAIRARSRVPTSASRSSSTISRASCPAASWRRPARQVDVPPETPSPEKKR
jgi:hypothetical protein